MKKKKIESFIQEGVNPTNGVVILISSIGDNYDNPQNRIHLIKNNKKFEFGLNGIELISIDASSDGKTYALCDDGAVLKFNWLKPKNTKELKKSAEIIENLISEDIGPLRRIRIIGSDVLCAGSVGQVYKLLNNDTFESLPILKFENTEPTIEDICGTSIDDFIAVTSEGYAFHFDGIVWEKLNLPSNGESMNSICLFENKNYGICGKGSLIIISNNNEWEEIKTLDNEQDYYGIGYFSSRVYISHTNGIDLYEHNELVSMNFPSNEENEIGMLRSGIDGVWTFGSKLGIIKDNKWNTYSLDDIEFGD